MNRQDRTFLEEQIATVLYPPDWEPPTGKRGDDDPDRRESDKRWVATGARLLAQEVVDVITKDFIPIQKADAHLWVNCNEDIQMCSHHDQDHVFNLLCEGLEGDSRYTYGGSRDVYGEDGRPAS